MKISHHFFRVGVKAFLGCTQHMSQYCRYYGVIASPLHRLTRVMEPFPKQWLLGTDYDIAFYRIKSMMLDESLFLWNKDSLKRLFIEVDACNEGWGACAYQYNHINRTYGINRIPSNRHAP